MPSAKNKLRTALSWVAMGALFVLCGVLGVLQYRWIGEVSRAERERLRESLQQSLGRLSRDFNAEIAAPFQALQPGGGPFAETPSETDYASRYARWKASARHKQLVRRIAVATPKGNELALRVLDLERGVFQPADWPEDWSRLRNRLADRGETGPMPMGGGLLQEFPSFEPRSPESPPDRPGPRVLHWLIVEADLGYIRSTLLPEMLRSHLGGGRNPPYRAEVRTNTPSQEMIFQSDPGSARIIQNTADASVGLLDLPGRGGPPGGFRQGGRGRARGRGPGGEGGRWTLLVRHRAGSLEAVVTQTRRRNLGVTAAVLLLMLAAAGSLIRYTQSAQRLARLQMDFVAGVSHELRTPLTVMRTLAYNLRGRTAQDPDQVAKYGALIEKESEKLTTLVEQVLQFAGSEANRTIGERRPESAEAVVREALAASKTVLEDAHCAVEERIEPGLPPVLADATALKHAVQNLLSNAAKYGTNDSNWIGVSIERLEASGEPMVEIRVEDRGPGIPHDEMKRVFDPFFRGKRAIQKQIHGAGLGLSLAKRIVEAHGGTIQARSGPSKGAEFVVRIPAAPPEQPNARPDSAHRG